jgi:hypothetical protein
MQRISSGTARVMKVVFPIVWFGLLAGVVVLGLFAKDAHGNRSATAVIFPLIMAAVGYYLMKKLMWGLADEVIDAGDSLIIRKRGEEEQIPLSNIINVGYSPLADPSRVTLSLRMPSRFGNQISFYVKTKLTPFAVNPIVTELIERIDRARQSAR